MLVELLAVHGVTRHKQVSLRGHLFCCYILSETLIILDLESIFSLTEFVK